MPLPPLTFLMPVSPHEPVLCIPKTPEMYVLTLRCPLNLFLLSQAVQPLLIPFFCLSALILERWLGNTVLSMFGRMAAILTCKGKIATKKVNLCAVAPWFDSYHLALVMVLKHLALMLTAGCWRLRSGKHQPLCVRSFNILPNFLVVLSLFSTALL